MQSLIRHPIRVQTAISTVFDEMLLMNVRFSGPIFGIGILVLSPCVSLSQTVVAGNWTTFPELTGVQVAADATSTLAGFLRIHCAIGGQIDITIALPDVAHPPDPEPLGMIMTIDRQAYYADGLFLAPFASGGALVSLGSGVGNYLLSDDPRSENAVLLGQSSTVEFEFHPVVRDAVLDEMELDIPSEVLSGKIVFLTDGMSDAIGWVLEQCR
ncbi:hypothetical protein [Rhodobacter sp. SY28-1]|uniref:hypothetical protein n=1 Tax=Rhodobacter sp. SY28-1 TaxID=2562317 RepID=UPI0010C08B18|nr:hypothetical protein [Rhodobacter sp. SY28-1]